MEQGFADANVEDLPSTKQSLYNWQRGSKVLLKSLG
jgi:N-acetylglutamate synthase-like GNAT family acetyltransferase